jgi:hypothetical protein
MWSAGASETVKAAYMQSASQKGALAADQIRQRYYKKEWEQIQATRITPLRDQLQAAKDAREKTLMSTVMPVPRTMQPGESAQMSSELGLDIPGAQTVVPGKKGKDGQVGASTVATGAPQAAPNLAMQGETIGVTQHEDMLALMDPVSGVPVALGGPRGKSIVQNADSMFWGEYSRVTSSMMDTLGEYVGNPYADSMAENLIAEVIKQGNIATTGQTDPHDAERHMMDRQEFEADQEIKGQQIAEGKVQADTGAAEREIGAREAGGLIGTSKRFDDSLGSKIIGKYQTGKPLTKNEQFQAAAAARHERGLQEKQILARAKQDYYTIPPALAEIPQNWQGHMMTRDPVYQTFFGNAFADLANSKAGEINAMEPADREALIRAHGGGETDVLKAENQLWKDANLQIILKSITESSGASQKANDTAYIRRLPSLEAQDPNVATTIDATLDRFIAEARANGLDVDEERIRAQRYVPFVEATLGRDQGRDQWGDPLNMDPHTEQRATELFQRRNPPPPPPVESARVKHWRGGGDPADIDVDGMARPTPGLGLAEPEAPPEAPTGPLRAEPRNLPYNMNLLSDQPSEAQTAPALPTGLETSTSGSASEWERVYGAGAKRPGEAAADLLSGIVSGVATAGRSLFGYERGQREPGVVQENGFAYDMEGRPLDVNGQPLEYSNPYINMDPSVLKSLAISLPPESQAHKLIADAITALEGE